MRGSSVWQGGGQGITVGHLDTAIDLSHQILQHARIESRYFSPFGLTDPDGEGLVARRHGTSTAAIICGCAVAERRIGLAPATTLFNAAVIPTGQIISRILYGLQWLIDERVRLICMPFGLPEPNPVLDTMMAVLRRRNILPIAAVGNRGAGVACSPATAPGVLAVGAVDEAGKVARFSGSLNPNGHHSCLKPDILAPGVDILSAAPGGGLARKSGTSMAAAYVAGVAALLLEEAPFATADELEAALVKTARPLPRAQAYRCAGGIIQPEAALKAITSLRRPARAIPAPAPQQTFRDPRLLRQLRYMDAGATIEAVIVAGEDTAEDDARGPAGPVVDELCAIAGEQPRRVRFLPMGRIAIVQGSVRLIRSFVETEAIQTLSAVDVDRWQF